MAGAAFAPGFSVAEVAANASDRRHKKWVKTHTKESEKTMRISPSITKKGILEFFNKFAQTATKKIEIAKKNNYSRKRALAIILLTAKTVAKLQQRIGKMGRREERRGKWTVGKLVPCL